MDAFVLPVQIGVAVPWLPNFGCQNGRATPWHERGELAKLLLRSTTLVAEHSLLLCNVDSRARSQGEARGGLAIFSLSFCMAAFFASSAASSTRLPTPRLGRMQKQIGNNLADEI